MSVPNPELIVSDIARAEMRENGTPMYPRGSIYETICKRWNCEDLRNASWDRLSFKLKKLSDKRFMGW